MRRTALFIVIGLALAAGARLLEVQPRFAPEVGLAKLQNGNARFVKGGFKRPNQTVDRRLETAKGQNPFAAILTCADSRLAPELIFDQGIGDLFVLRVAGNTADPKMVGSLEYAIEHLGANIVVVMGHSKCGAVDAALSGAQLPGSLPDVIAPIQPAVAETAAMKGDRLLNATMQNVRNTVKLIKNTSPMIAGKQAAKKVMIFGAYFDIEVGSAKFFKVE